MTPDAPLSLTTLAVIVGAVVTGITGTVALMGMIHMVRTDIATLKLEMTKDRQIVELRINRMEAELAQLKTTLNTIMYQLFREGTLKEVTDVEEQD